MSLKSLIRLAKERKVNEQSINQPSHHQSITQSNSNQSVSESINQPLISLSKAPHITQNEWESHYKIGSIPSCYYVKDWISESDAEQLMRSINRSNNQSSTQSNNQWVHVRGRKLLCYGPTPGQPIESCQPIPPFIQSLMNRVGESSAIWSTTNQSNDQRTATINDATGESVDPSSNQSTNQATDASSDQLSNQQSVHQSNNQTVDLNHALINYYPRGGGIHAHKDGPAYHHRVVIVSLSSPCIIRFDERPPPAIDQSIAPQHRPRPPVALYLEPRSLLVFTDQLYTDDFHSIDPVTSDYVSRTSVDNFDHVSVQTEGLFERTDRISITLRHAIKK